MRFPKNLSRACLFEQLAEESTELAHAAQKMARKLRGENPIDEKLSTDMLRSKLVEEFTDVILCAEYLDLNVDPKLRTDKNNRWIERLNKSNMISVEELFNIIEEVYFQ